MQIIYLVTEQTVRVMFSGNAGPPASRPDHEHWCHVLMARAGKGVWEAGQDRFQKINSSWDIHDPVCSSEGDQQVLVSDFHL